MKKKDKDKLQTLIIILATIVISTIFYFAGQIFFKNSLQTSAPTLQQAKENKKNNEQNKTHLFEIKIEDTKVKVELAKTAQEQTKGLSNRKFLPANQGMLFVYKKQVKPSFWMKDMLFPIDIIWIAEGKVVGFEEQVQPPEVEKKQQLNIYSPPRPITAVLEVNAGFLKKNNISIGSPVEFSNLNPSI